MTTTNKTTNNTDNERDLFQFQCLSLAKKPKSDRRLCWRVFILNMNSNKIEAANVFDLNYSMNKRIYEATKNLKDFEQWEAKIHSALHELWSRYQYEINMSDLQCREESQSKIDCFTQIAINWDNFIDYLWFNKNVILEELKPK